MVSRILSRATEANHTDSSDHLAISSRPESEASWIGNGSTRHLSVSVSDLDRKCSGSAVFSV